MIHSLDKKKSLLITLLTFTLSLFILTVFVPNHSYAVNVDNTGGVGGNASIDATNLSSIGSILARVVNLAAWGVGGVFIIMILVTAIKYAMAQGDPKGLEGAKNTLTYAIFGFLVAIGFFAISSIVTRALGIDQNLITSPGEAVRTNIEKLMDYLETDSFDSLNTNLSDEPDAQDIDGIYQDEDGTWRAPGGL